MRCLCFVSKPCSAAIISEKADTHGRTDLYAQTQACARLPTRTYTQTDI